MTCRPQKSRPTRGGEAAPRPAVAVAAPTSRARFAGDRVGEKHPLRVEAQAKATPAELGSDERGRVRDVLVDRGAGGRAALGERGEVGSDIGRPADEQDAVDPVVVGRRSGERSP